MNDYDEYLNKFRNKLNTEYDKVETGFLKECLKLFFDLDEDDVEIAIEGLGSNDLGVDAYFYDKEDENLVHLIQSKYESHHRKQKSNLSSFKNEWVSLLEDFEKKVRNGFVFENIKGVNKKIKEISRDIREHIKDGGEVRKTIFHMGFASNFCLEYNSGVSLVDEEMIVEKYKKNILLAEESDCIFNIEHDIDVKDSKKRIKNEDFKLEISHPDKQYKQHGHILTTVKNAKKVLIAPISATQLVSMYEKFDDILFERNIRDFLGESSSVNKKMIETAKKDPANFLAYNNGVNITCDSFKTNSPNNDVLQVTLENPQVINGAQTVGSLYEAYKQIKKSGGDLKNFQKAFVLCKIVESNKDDEANFATNLTKFSNSQNQILNWDFFSKEKIHEEIKAFFSKYNILYNYRRREKISQAKMRKWGYNSQLNIEDLGEIFIGQKDLTAKAQKKEIFKISDDKNSKSDLYLKCFPDKPDRDPKHLSELILSYLISKKVNSLHKEFKFILENGYYGKSSEFDFSKNLLSRALGLKSYKSYEKNSNLEEEKKVNFKIQKICYMDPRTFSYIVNYMVDNLEFFDPSVNSIKSKKTDILSRFSANGGTLDFDDVIFEYLKCAMESYFIFAFEFDEKPYRKKENIVKLQNSIQKYADDFSALESRKIF